MKNFEQTIARPALTLVEFYATWCGPCRTMQPILDHLAEALGEQITILRYDIDDKDNEQLVARHSIRSVPTLVLYRSAKVLWRGSGVMSSEHLRELIAQFERDANAKH